MVSDPRNPQCADHRRRQCLRSGRSRGAQAGLDLDLLHLRPTGQRFATSERFGDGGLELGLRRLRRGDDLRNRTDGCLRLQRPSGAIGSIATRGCTCARRAGMIRSRAAGSPAIRSATPMARTFMGIAAADRSDGRMWKECSEPEPGLGAAFGNPTISSHLGIIRVDRSGTPTILELSFGLAQAPYRARRP